MELPLDIWIHEIAYHVRSCGPHARARLRCGCRRLRDADPAFIIPRWLAAWELHVPGGTDALLAELQPFSFSSVDLREPVVWDGMWAHRFRERSSAHEKAHTRRYTVVDSIQPKPRTSSRFVLSWDIQCEANSQPLWCGRVNYHPAQGWFMCTDRRSTSSRGPLKNRHLNLIRRGLPFYSPLNDFLVAADDKTDWVLADAEFYGQHVGGCETLLVDHSTGRGRLISHGGETAGFEVTVPATVKGPDGLILDTTACNVMQ